ncbi:uncharacterized protein PGTG_09074 [Puccinia graminis f. sp. tritici CRL 75-36-700-3]|uniref:Uncharacterized protein n=1 Tax=Puccinia graminis f. sp. tritici (strain CRL 75-36-700-3 / race SCCL) TaxID=418459 RepID=E3KFQ7_PUCGT|nr:uncharacterized protein PGTG_09074 [Puccinia graminis f. sp. tritici CRL 75-36-700-3]EFP83121.1 hypothetical protein PGTG_09074 [Puccinia graminis f. sp. tritici CRL 75-36-700-3]
MVVDDLDDSRYDDLERRMNSHKRKLQAGMLTNVINYLSAGWTSVKPGGGSRCASGRGPGAAADIIFKASRKKDGGSGAKSENRMVIDERQRSECVPLEAEV